MIRSFQVVENWLTWRIGNETKYRVGTDLWSDSDKNHILFESLVQKLHQNGFHTLNQIVDPLLISIWNKGWKEARQLRFEGDHI